MVAYSECSLAKDQPIEKPTRFKFTCHSFFAPAALCTGFLGIRTTDGGCSFQTSIRITNDMDGLFGYNVVLNSLNSIKLNQFAHLFSKLM